MVSSGQAPTPRTQRSPVRLLSPLSRLALLILAAGAFSLSGQEATQPVPGEHVRFCAYNVKNWLNMDRAYGERVQIASKPEKEKEAVIATIKAISPDILGLCEIGGPDDLKDIQTRLKKAGIDMPHFENVQGGDATRTLGLLSRYPIVARDPQNKLTYRIGETVFPIQRGILDVTIQIKPDFVVRALGVHLKSMREVPEADQSLMRRNEAHLLRQHINDIFKKEPKVKLLAYGDFNEHAHEPPIDAIKGNRAEPETYMNDIQLRDLNGEVWTHFWDTADSYSRLDYFFVSPELRNHSDFRASFIYTNKKFYEASDHRPIVLGIRMESFKKADSK